MAKVLFTAVVADMRNKLNGTVFSKNRYGAYTRTKVTPVNRRSDAQMLQRSQLGSLSASWRGLTEAQRTAWNDAAINFPRTDIFGNKKILSGQALYVGLNTNLLNAGEGIISAPPTPSELPVFSIAEWVLYSDDAGETLQAQVTLDAALPSDYKALIFVSPPVSAGRSFIGNFKLLSPGAPIVPGGTPKTLYNIVTPLYNTIGFPPEGTKVAVRVVVVNIKTGEASVPLESTAIMTFS